MDVCKMGKPELICRVFPFFLLAMSYQLWAPYQLIKPKTRIAKQSFSLLSYLYIYGRSPYHYLCPMSRADPFSSHKIIFVLCQGLTPFLPKIKNPTYRQFPQSNFCTSVPFKWLFDKEPSAFISPLFSYFTEPFIKTRRKNELLIYKWTSPRS